MHGASGGESRREPAASAGPALVDRGHDHAVGRNADDEQPVVGRAAAVEVDAAVLDGDQSSGGSAVHGGAGPAVEPDEIACGEAARAGRGPRRCGADAPWRPARRAPARRHRRRRRRRDRSSSGPPSPSPWRAAAIAPAVAASRAAATVARACRRRRGGPAPARARLDARGRGSRGRATRAGQRRCPEASDPAPPEAPARSWGQDLSQLAERPPEPGAHAAFADPEDLRHLGGVEPAPVAQADQLPVGRRPASRRRRAAARPLPRAGAAPPAKGPRRSGRAWCRGRRTAGAGARRRQSPRTFRATVRIQAFGVPRAGSKRSAARTTFRKVSAVRSSATSGERDVEPEVVVDGRPVRLVPLAAERLRGLCRRGSGGGWHVGSGHEWQAHEKDYARGARASRGLVAPNTRHVTLNEVKGPMPAWPPSRRAPPSVPLG